MDSGECSNGGYSYLPSIKEINFENKNIHKVSTNYGNWAPISSFELQKSKLTTKSLQLYEGEIVYPVGMEFTNELRLTFVDDSWKSWRRYFEKCAKVAVFNSTPHKANFYKYIYFDYDGDIVEISESFVDRDYMRVEGVTCEEAEIGKKLRIGDDEIGYLTSLIKILNKNNLMPNGISYDDRGRITLRYDTYNISLGSSVYLEEKIDRLTRILPQIEGLYGTLHLENYSNQNTDIVFEKEEITEE
jgi:hypothetical protein